MKPVELAERAVSRLLARRWYDFERRPPGPLVMLWGVLLRFKGKP